MQTPEYNETADTTEVTPKRLKKPRKVSLVYYTFSFNFEFLFQLQTPEHNEAADTTEVASLKSQLTESHLKFKQLELQLIEARKRTEELQKRVAIVPTAPDELSTIGKLGIAQKRIVKYEETIAELRARVEELESSATRKARKNYLFISNCIC